MTPIAKMAPIIEAGECSKVFCLCGRVLLFGMKIHTVAAWKFSQARNEITYFHWKDMNLMKNVLSAWA